MIRCERLTHVYGVRTPLATAAITDVSLTIDAGEVVGLIGATGSGKSTLVQHFNALLRPTSGRVLLDGADVNGRGTDRQSVRRQVGLLFQSPEQQLCEEPVFADVGLPPARFASRSPFELSSGEMRRAAIAGVLAMEPRMLILDEPTAGLDPQGRREILVHISRLHKARGLTIVLITHSMDAVAQLCERLIILDRGRLVADGPTRAVFADPSRLTALGLGVPQVTLLARKLRERGLPVRPDVLTVEEARAAILEALVAHPKNSPSFALCDRSRECEKRSAQTNEGRLN